VFLGKEKAGLLQAAIDDYVARIERFYPVRTIYGKKPRVIDQALHRRRQRTYVTGLSEDGDVCDSLKFAGHLRTLMEDSTKELMFVVGEAEGLDPPVREKCDALLSLSPMTLNHRIARLVLVEQVYRALSIIHRTPYHR
jgi:23S rRNA (pseudouridine1915-N3)-methyltransferase